MKRIPLTVAVTILIIGMTSIMLANCGRQKIVRYTIRGSIELVNDCDGKVASLPKEVKVKASLKNKQGKGSAGFVKVPVAPDPADPAGTPRKIGNYSITVAWGPGLGNPTFWDTPEVTLTNGRDICFRTITCPDVLHDCRDVSTKTPRVPFVNPTATHNISMVCVCR